MTKAGYDPREAIPFWENMMSMSQGKRKPPEFLSTHPADINRIRKIQQEIPKALENYR
jgi:predicted Zn-dependent protease